MGFTGIALAAVALAAALAYWLRFAAREAPALAGAAVKAASTGCLAAILVLAPMAPAAAGLGWPVALGLALGALGDWFLARRGERAFLAGMAAFGAGHLGYGWGMLARGMDGLSPGEGAVLVALCALVLSTEYWLAPRTGRLRGPVRLYVLLIGLMGAAAVVMAAQPGRGLLRLGAALFLASDLLLAIRLFLARDPVAQRRLSLALWPVYWLGQALILAGALQAVAAEAG